MTMTLNHQNRKHWAAIIVVLVGWLLGAATTHLLKPDVVSTVHDYQMFYINCLMFRNAHFIFSAISLYYVRGSFPIWVLMGFNLVAIILNLLYLDPSNYAVYSLWRKEFFAPSYKAAEIIILIWMSYNVRADLLHIGRSLWYRFGLMGTRRTV